MVIGALLIQVRAVEEMRSSMTALVDQANKDRQEALDLYSQENRKRKLIHNKLLELQGTLKLGRKILADEGLTFGLFVHGVLLRQYTRVLSCSSCATRGGQCGGRPHRHRFPFPRRHHRPQVSKVDFSYINLQTPTDNRGLP